MFSMATVNRPSLLLLVLKTLCFLHSAAAPPPPLLSDQQQRMDRIIEAMIGVGDLRHWPADFLSSVDEQLGIPLSATVFIPSGYDPVSATTTTIIGGAGSNITTVAPMSPLAMAYHIVPQRLTFSDLCLIKPLSRLPTLLPGSSILITNTSVSNFTLDGSLLSDPDLFLSSSIAIHGISSPLDFSLYGGVYGHDDDSLVGGFLPHPGWEAKNGGISGSHMAARFSSWFAFHMVFAVACGILAIKILF